MHRMGHRHRDTLWVPLLRALSLGTALALAASLLMTIGAVWRQTEDVRHFQDFGQFYAATRAWLNNEPMYGTLTLPGSQTSEQRYNMNPPHFHLLLVPLALLPPSAAAALWWVLSVASLGASLMLLIRETRMRVSALTAAWIGVALLASAPMMAAAVTGQVGLLLTYPVTQSWISARRGHSAAAGAWMGLAASLKIFLVVFPVVWLITQPKRAGLVALVTIGTCFGVGFLTFGVGSFNAWLDHLRSVTWAEHYMNLSLLGLFERTLTTSEWRQVPVVDWPALVTPLWFAASAGVGAITLIRVKDVDQHFAAWVAVALLLSPLGWVYYGWLLFPPATAWGLRLPSRARLALLAGAAAWCVPVMLPSAHVGTAWATATIVSIYAWGLLVMWITIVSARPTATNRLLPRID